MNPGLHWEFTASGLAKQRAMKNIPKANGVMLTRWMSQVVEKAGIAAANMRKSKTNKTPGQMARGVGMETKRMGDVVQGIVGTGVGRATSVKYAFIQDKGGLTKPEITPRSRKFFWMMFFKTGDDKWKGMALTKKTVFNIFIPRSHWFTNVVEKRRHLLTAMLQPKTILAIAEKMGGK